MDETHHNLLSGVMYVEPRGARCRVLGRHRTQYSMPLGWVISILAFLSGGPAVGHGPGGGAAGAAGAN